MQAFSLPNLISNTQPGVELDQEAAGREFAEDPSSDIFALLLGQYSPPLNSPSIKQGQASSGSFETALRSLDTSTAAVAQIKPLGIAIPSVPSVDPESPSLITKHPPITNFDHNTQSFAVSAIAPDPAVDSALPEHPTTEVPTLSELAETIRIPSAAAASLDVETSVTFAETPTVDSGFEAAAPIQNHQFNTQDQAIQALNLTSFDASAVDPSVPSPEVTTELADSQPASTDAGSRFNPPEFTGPVGPFRNGTDPDPQQPLNLPTAPAANPTAVDPDLAVVATEGRLPTPTQQTPTQQTPVQSTPIQPVAVQPTVTAQLAAAAQSAAVQPAAVSASPVTRPAATSSIPAAPKSAFGENASPVQDSVQPNQLPQNYGAPTDLNDGIRRNAPAEFDVDEEPLDLDERPLKVSLPNGSNKQSAEQLSAFAPELQNAFTSPTTPFRRGERIGAVTEQSAFSSLTSPSPLNEMSGQANLQLSNEPLATTEVRVAPRADLPAHVHAMQKIVNELVAESSAVVNNKTMTVRFEEPHIGSVQLELTETDSGMSVSVAAGDDLTLEMLNTNSQQFERSLKDNQIELLEIVSLQMQTATSDHRQADQTYREQMAEFHRSNQTQNSSQPVTSHTSFQTPETLDFRA